MAEPYLPRRYVLEDDGFISDPYEMRSVADVMLEAEGKAPFTGLRVVPPDPIWEGIDADARRREWVLTNDRMAAKIGTWAVESLGHHGPKDRDRR